MSGPEIGSNSLRVEVIPEAGAKLASIKGRVGSDWLELGGEGVDSPKAFFCAGGTHVNRAKGGRIVIDGKVIDLKHPMHPGTALHSIWPWIEHRVVEHNQTSVRLEFICSQHAKNFVTPSDFKGTTEFSIDGEALNVKLTVENLENKTLQTGLVTHPMFRKAVGADSRPWICFRACSYYPMEENIPVGTLEALPQRLNYAQLRELEDGADDCLRGWDGVAYARYPRTGYEWLIEDVLGNCNHLQFWSDANRGVYAIEPQNSVTAASHLLAGGMTGLGVVTLRRIGETFAVHHRYTWRRACANDCSNQAG
jgi:galactose mutarotase-like enzyme